MSDLEGHYTRVVGAIANHQIVPFLGANINLCGRKRDTNNQPEGWELGKTPPSNRELAIFLNEQSGNVYLKDICCPLCDTVDTELLPDGCPVREKAITKIDLQHVSQYVVNLEEEGPDVLYGALHGLVNADYSPNPLHNFFALLPGIMRKKGYYPPYPLIVSTCFDRTLEHAFEKAGEFYDLVSFVADQQGGRFAHQLPGEEPHLIEDPNAYQKLSLNDCSVILKLYGGMGEDFVITEDHYIDYLSHRHIAELLPANLLKQLRRNCIWFMGYSPSYWNLRVILHRIWPEQMSGKRRQTWWAVQSHPEIIDKLLWRRYNGLPISTPSIDEYIAELDQRLHDIPPKKVIQGLNLLHSKVPTVKRDQVFICYSHRDKYWLEEIQKMLKPAIQAEKFLIWDDTQIKPGEKWRGQIKAAIASAKVAILLVSADFLASDFIAQEELPPLLEAARQEGLTIVWVYINDCLYRHSAIADYQAGHDISQPLESLEAPHQRTILKTVSEKIIEAIKTP